jgi:hypothetical protein
MALRLPFNYVLYCTLVIINERTGTLLYTVINEPAGTLLHTGDN